VLDPTTLDEWQWILSPTPLAMNSASLGDLRVYAFALLANLVLSALSAEFVASNSSVKVSNVCFCRFFE